MAVKDKLTGRFVDFRITPKGKAARGRLPYRVVSVNAVLALGCLLPVLLVGEIESATGFYVLSLITGLLYTATVAVIVLRHAAENGWGVMVGRAQDAVLHFGTVAALALFAGFTATMRLQEGVYGLSIGSGLEPVEVSYRVSGAGSSMAGPEMEFHWNVPWRWTAATLPAPTLQLVP
jgi:cellulose synthase (UDP-forming)